MAVLRKGLNFAPTPKVLPITEIISGVEPALRKYNEDQAYVVERTRAIIADTLQKAKPIQQNILKGEREGIRSFRTNKDITILSADKGNSCPRYQDLRREGTRSMSVTV